MPTSPDILEADFADDKAMIASNPDHTHATHTLQLHLHKLEEWCHLWKVQINQQKSQHITFTLRRLTCPPIYFNNIPIPQTDEVQYLGMTFDRRLTWKPHIHRKRITLNKRLKLLTHLLCYSSKLQLKQRLNIYTYLLKPIWAYGSQIYGTAKRMNIERIQQFQSKTLRLITKAPPYESNLTIHTDLDIPFVHSQIKQYYTKFYHNTNGHTNPLIHLISTTHFNDTTQRRLKRSWMRDLLM